MQFLFKMNNFVITGNQVFKILFIVIFHQILFKICFFNKKAQKLKDEPKQTFKNEIYKYDKIIFYRFII